MSTPTLADLQALELRVGLPLQDHQREAAADALQQVRQGAWLRLCLYHRTGAGKTYTALVCVALAGVQDVLVLAPPITHETWVGWGRRVGVAVTTISHAKFRQKGFKVRRDQAMIVDEFHLLGGHKGQGWRKLDRMAQGLQAPLVIASATPNYNDAERVYCIQHVLDPHSVKGGYLQFLYDHCITKVNPFGAEPLVEGFRNYTDAEDYLKHLDHVHYVEDEAIKQVTITDVELVIDVPDELLTHGLDHRRQRVIASLMEGRHALKRHQILTEDGLIRPEVYDEIADLVGLVRTPTLIFCNSREVAEALFVSVGKHASRALLITGKTSTKEKQEIVKLFRQGAADVLIGTASLATGTDGIDKMCDHLLIVDDTDDNALRRQLIGRILPRGLDSDLSNKIVSRLVYS